MTSELDAAALGAVDDMVEIVSPRPTWQPDRSTWRVWSSMGGNIEFWPDGIALKAKASVGGQTRETRLLPTDVRDLILALQQWLATKEGLG